MPAIAKLQLQRNNTCITIMYAGGAPEIEQLQLQQDELLFYMTDPIHGQYEKDKWSHSILSNLYKTSKNSLLILKLLHSLYQI